MKSLLIYQNIPESTRYFVLPERYVARHREVLDAAHGRYGGSDLTNDAMRLLCNAVNEVTCFDDVDPKFTSSLMRFEVLEEQDEPFVGPFERVFVTGWMM